MFKMSAFNVDTVRRLVYSAYKKSIRLTLFNKNSSHAFDTVLTGLTSIRDRLTELP